MNPLATYFPGPEPKLQEPSLDGAVEAQRALAMALEKNKQAGNEVAGITQEQAELLLEWIVYKARRALLEKERNVRGNEETCPAPFFADPFFVGGMCTRATPLVNAQAKMFGLKAGSHHIRELLDGPSDAHTFSTVTFPLIDSTGHCKEQTYLVDITFRQFFDEFFKDHRDGWANKMLQTAQGKNLADQVLSHGFLRLDATALEIYLSSNTRNHPEYYSSTAEKEKRLQRIPLISRAGLKSKK